MAEPLILCYHAVSEDWPAALSVRPAAFERQLKMLASRGYRGCRFTELVDGFSSGGKAVAITFDDAYSSVLELAAPIMERFGFVGTVFVPTDFPGGGPMEWPGIDHWTRSPHRKELQSLSWDELRGLRDDGWEVGSHTCSHPRLTETDDHQLERELRESRWACEQALGHRCTSIAYPYGDHDDRVVAATEAAGYSAAATLPFELRWRSPLRAPRVGIYHDDALWRFAAKALGPFRSARSSRLAARANDLRTRRRRAPGMRPRR